MALRPDSSKSTADKIAERDSQAQDVFLREVSDAVREDDMRNAFNRYGKPAGIGIVLGLAALAGYLWWDDSQKATAGTQGEEFTMALDRVEAGHLDSGDKALQKLAHEAGGDTAASAKLMQGGIAMEKGDKVRAAKLFAQVAADEDAAQPFRDLATIREIAINFDSMPPQQVVDRLKALAVPGNAWFGNAGELLGMAYLKQGNAKLAGPLFAAISRDKETSDSLRSRARQMAGLLGVDAIDDPEKLLQETAESAAPASLPAN